MRQRILCNIALLFGLYCLAERASAAETPTIITSRSQFTIPFRYDPVELQRLQATQVLLFVSRDQGLSWQTAQTGAITQNEFAVQLAEDGNYWFSVAVNGANGQLHPDPKQQPPGLHIIVDRQPPDLGLQLQELHSGQLELTWEIRDPQVDLQSLLLEYRNSSVEDWKAVYITREPAGRTSWKFTPGQLPEVRGQVSDQAGNQQQIQVKLTPSATDLTRSPSSITPAARQESHTGIVIQSRPSTPAIAEPSSIPQVQLISETVESGPSLTVPALQTHATSPNDQSLVQPQQWAESANPAPVVTQKPLQNLSSQNGRLRYLNAHDFQIEYQVTGLGPSGVGVVELFVTQDGGQQWWRYGVDADLVSPMSIKVPEDGAYGFHFRIHSGVGNADPPPQPGQAPQIQVLVDSTAPQLKLLKAYQGHGSLIQQLTVQWDCVDEHLGDKPITLFVASHSSGPWQQVDSRVENVGSHTFVLPENAPTRLFVKVQAIDAAGNLSEAIAEQPLLIDLSRPSARVITIDAIR